MSRKLEKELEQRIFEKAVDALLAAGYRLTVNDGEEDVLQMSVDRKAIIEAAFSTDEDYLIVFLPNGTKRGWVRFIWGNVQDCLSDYTVNLEEVLKPVNEFAATYD